MPASSPGVYVVLYATLYGAFGVASPFWPRLFESRGLTPQQIGTVLAAGLLVRLAAGPAIGRLADRSGRLRAMLSGCLVLAAATSAGLAGAQGFVLIFGIALVQAAALAPTTSLADALAVSADPPARRQRPFEYGWIRGGASLAFVLGTLLAGQLIAPNDLSPAIWANAMMLFAAAVLAAAPVHASANASRPAAGSIAGAVRALMGMPPFRAVMAVSALVYGSHAMYDGFAVIRWNAAGLDATTVSLLWSEAVGAEVVVFLLIGPRLIDRLGPRGAMALAASAGVVRWSVFAFTDSPFVLLAVQPLHGLTFSLLHLACMRLIAGIVPVRLAATAQSLYAFGSAMVTALLMWASGWIYGAGSTPFLVMAALCVLALAWTGLASRSIARCDDGGRDHGHDHGSGAS